MNHTNNTVNSLGFYIGDTVKVKNIPSPPMAISTIHTQDQAVKTYGINSEYMVDVIWFVNDEMQSALVDSRVLTKVEEPSIAGSHS